ncbi:hypothetical protein RJ639_035669 [Escallonia herrerae]|uniref:Glutaredoxin domain-containing protein n=1 Tax=Escallonia herrerae TaxID=1293975 RepID=A0AA89BAD8_9ASTE|nr:hypothetical protein RJ639_035669 [Escallonia herrerae]
MALPKPRSSFPRIQSSSSGDGSDLQSALAELSGQRTVPNVFIGGKHIGGCDKTTAMYKAGQLVPLLTEAGAIATKSAS